MIWTVRLEDQSGTVDTKQFSTGHDAARFAIGKIADGLLHRKQIEAVIYIED